ncbi:unnamed protein product [Chironomus riparius]|uniref:BTB domain-containing protein n=1 Tax=Chironomus riparius TaxID=315576 RepID=A0A9N9S2S1_9DIPT|nr:unnamed protein product [Chironomus riparius]
MNFFCEFAEFTFKHGGKVYGCTVKNQHIPENIDLNFQGLHWFGKSFLDVQDVQFSDCTVTKVPQGLTRIFPNLRILCINNSKLKKISKNDLIEYRHFETFFFEQNELEFLPGDLFEDFQNIEWMSFFGNQLEVIEYNILDGLTKLKFVCFTLNQNYDKCYSVYPDYDSNASLEDVKKDLLDKFFSRHKMLTDLRDSLKILVKEKVELQAANEKLKVDNDLLVGFEKKMYKDILKLRNTQKKLEDEIEELENPEPNCSKVQHLSGIFGDVKDLIKDDKFKDFEITVGDETFRVHKFLLIARCLTLSDILINDPKIECINFTYISADIIKLVVDFIYTDEFPRNKDINYLQLFIAASRLKIAELQNFSATKVFDQINAENALYILKMSNKYNHAWLMQQTFNKIKEIRPKIELEDEWAKQPGRVEAALKNLHESDLDDKIIL